MRGRSAFAMRCGLAVLLLSASLAASRIPHPASRAPQGDAPLRVDRGRFTAVCYPTDEKLATALLARAVAND